MRIEVQGLKDNLRILSKIDPALRKEFGKRFRTLAKPAAEEMDRSKPSGPTLPRGFQHGGRTGSGTVKKIRIDINTRRARRRNIAQGAQYETIGTIRLMSGKGDVATAIADMAGRKGDVKYGGRTRAYVGRPAGHAINGQGDYLIAKLNAAFGPPSRSLWPAAERALSGVEREFIQLAKDVEDIVNRELMKIGSSAHEVRGLMR